MLKLPEWLKIKIDSEPRQNALPKYLIRLIPALKASRVAVFVPGLVVQLLSFY